MNILITGGAGFIGTHLCKQLHKNGHNVTVVDNFLPQVHGNPDEINKKRNELINYCVVVNGSVDRITTWAYLEKEFDVIICLAAETGTGQSMMEADSYCQTNINSIALLNDLIVRGHLKCGKIILASSRSVYGDAKLDKSGYPIATKETDPVNPKSIYAVTKLAQEQLLFAGFGDTEVCALRFQNVYGPGQSLKNPYTGILSIFSTAIYNDNDIQIFSDGLMTRDFVYVDDIVDSIELVMHKGKSGEIYNVGSGYPTSVLDVAKTLKELYGSDVSINITGEELDGDIRNNFADISKIQKLGFIPKYTFKKGVSKFVDWVKEQGELKENEYSSSLDEFRKKGLLK